MNNTARIAKVNSSQTVRKATQLLRLFQNRMGPDSDCLDAEDRALWQEINKACRDLGRLDPTPDQPCDGDCLGCAGKLRERVSAGYRGDATHSGHEDYPLNAKGKTSG